MAVLETGVAAQESEVARVALELAAGRESAGPIASAAGIFRAAVEEIEAPSQADPEDLTGPARAATAVADSPAWDLGAEEASAVAEAPEEAAVDADSGADRSETITGASI